MVPRRKFVGQVADAYEHLYDLVRLRTHPLADMLVDGPELDRKEKAWQLHRVLLQAVDDLDPGPHSPPLSHEWRRHRLLVLHHVDGLDPQTVANRLGISRRHFYREHRTAIAALADLLWERCKDRAAPSPQPLGPYGEERELDLLRLEAVRMARAERRAQPGEVVAGVLSLLQGVLEQRQLALRSEVPEPLPDVAMDAGLLRQLLLGVLGALIEGTEQATIELRAAAKEAGLHVSLRVEPPAAVRPLPPEEREERLSALAEIAQLAGARLQPQRAAGAVYGFEVHLPSGPQRTVLVVDDNEDVLALFQRYLTPHRYRVATAQTAQKALAEAHRLQPYAITLDLMMPGQDGWALMQTLLSQPGTHDIPVIVCSVLKQRDLALSLGATAFLEKPVTEQALLAALTALESG